MAGWLAVRYSTLAHFRHFSHFNHFLPLLQKLQILLYLPLLLYFPHCSKSPTDSKGLSLTGSVKLEGETDHSGTTVALYALAELDTMGVRLNKEFPMVGIPISQVTEFACPPAFWRACPPAFWRDHRLGKPIYQTQTKADGSYKLERTKEGIYSLAAKKRGYGWKYLYMQAGRSKV